ncbi:MAG: hypothetical protein LBS49_09740 [Candidatus Accumulibacter sp.]|jgi:hypothetical protein|nr:hypothetical protein [Accumulibacter sp.]
METTSNRAQAHEIGRAAALARETVRFDLLADIDKTVDFLALRSSKFLDSAAAYGEVKEYIDARPVVQDDYLDPDDEIIGLLLAAEDVLKNYIPRMTLKRGSIDRNTRLTGDHRESLHQAYEELLFNAAVLLESIQTVRAAIIGHDLEAEPRDVPEFDTAGELIAELRR